MKVILFGATGMVGQGALRECLLDRTAAGMSEPSYRKVTYDLTLSVARALVPLFPLWRALFPRFVTTNESVAKAMLVVAKRGAEKKILENADINALAEEPLLATA